MGDLTNVQKLVAKMAALNFILMMKEGGSKDINFFGNLEHRERLLEHARQEVRLLIDGVREDGGSGTDEEIAGSLLPQYEI